MELICVYGVPCVAVCFVLIFLIKQHIEEQKNDLEKINKRLDDVEYETKSIAYELGMKSLPPGKPFLKRL